MFCVLSCWDTKRLVLELYVIPYEGVYDEARRSTSRPFGGVYFEGKTHTQIEFRIFISGESSRTVVFGGVSFSLAMVLFREVSVPLYFYFTLSLSRPLCPSSSPPPHVSPSLYFAVQVFRRSFDEIYTRSIWAPGGEQRRTMSSLQAVGKRGFCLERPYLPCAHRWVRWQ